MSQLQQKILIKRCTGTKAALLWPLVLYGFVQLAANLLSTTTTNSSNNLLTTSPQFNANNDHRFEVAHQCQTTTSGRALKKTTAPASGLKSCSSTTEISLPVPLLSSPQPLLPASASSSSLAYLYSLLQIFNNFDSGLSKIFSGRKLVLMAEATTITTTSYSSHHNYPQPNQEKGIIILNSTNFNTELIQHNHPFPHLKLIEYYLAHCRVCAKFKSTYTKLAREIFPWRNVIRPSAIDLSISTNSPIAHSWSVETVPTMRIYPPPEASIAEQLDKQLSSSSKSLNQGEYQKAMLSEHNSSNLMIQSLDVLQYMDKVSLLKSDLVRYIERYTRDNKLSQLPSSWPNLKPVTETSLLELYRNHPRQELFLLIEGPATTTTTSVSDQSSSSGASSATMTMPQTPPPLSLHIMLELSSRAPWKAIRYVRASENRALIEDVIAQQSKVVVSELSSDKSKIGEQVELLNSLLSNNSNNNQAGGNNNNILLVHKDDSHSPSKTGTQTLDFPFMTIVTGKDLLAMEQSITASNEQLNAQPYDEVVKYAKAAKRSTINHHLDRDRRSSSSVQADHLLNNMSVEREIELFALYIRQTYTETGEDRDFVRAISEFDSSKSRADFETSSTPPQPPTDSSSSSQNNKALQTNQDNNKSLSTATTTTTNSLAEEQESQKSLIVKDSTLLNKILNLFSSSSEKTYKVISSSSSSSPWYSSSCDYEDKLKAIRYLLFNEIPKTSIFDKGSSKEQQEKLSILVNLITVIKSYFPLPDLPSIQFIDGVQSYLIKQQTRLANLSGNINQETAGGVGNGGFDKLAFKQELKRLESEDKRLPEVKEWKHCTGYPCALWRLFHTLTAFEYKKLRQIRHPSTLRPPPPSSSSLQKTHPPQSLFTTNLSSTGLQQSDSNLSPLVEAITMNSSNLEGPPSPVERLVSPPSTTTSLSLTIVAPSTTLSSQQVGSQTDSISNNNKQQPLSEADLPAPVILVMRDYITNFFSCYECALQFRTETADLSFERIRQQEPAEFSILWLWETHNRVNKRLSVDPITNPPERPKVWFPTFDKCTACYKKPPSYLQDTATSVVDASIFYESIEWNKQEVLCFLQDEYTKQPMDSHINLFGDQVVYGFGYIIVTCLGFLLFAVLLRCTTNYIERQRRHKATLLNGNGAHYSLELH